MNGRIVGKKPLYVGLAQPKEERRAMLMVCNLVVCFSKCFTVVACAQNLFDEQEVEIDLIFARHILLNVTWQWQLLHTPDLSRFILVTLRLVRSHLRVQSLGFRNTSFQEWGLSLQL